MAQGAGTPLIGMIRKGKPEEVYNSRSREMTEIELFQIADSIEELDREMMALARARQESLAKPPGSLGGLEDMSVKMAGITGKLLNTIEKTCVAVFCADNGVAAQNVASAPQSVTMAQTVNFTRRLTGVGALAESFGSELLIVDMGVKHPIPKELYDDEPLRDTHKIIDRRIRPETNDISQGPAMSRKEALRCIEIGMEMADAVKNAGYDITGVGEMGIGNTTTSAAVLSAVTGKSSDWTCGKGGGINDASFSRKKKIVDMVSAEYRGKGAGRSDMLDILARMGGFDICAMAGMFMGAARNKMPVVIDGYISVVAAVAAYVLAPASINYMFASHRSFERGYQTAIDVLGLKPFLELGMRLGEGSGCPIAFHVIKGACDVMRNMATFEEAEINDDYLEEIRKGDCF